MNETEKALIAYLLSLARNNGHLRHKVTNALRAIEKDFSYLDELIERLEGDK